MPGCLPAQRRGGLSPPRFFPVFFPVIFRFFAGFLPVVCRLFADQRRHASAPPL
jgi:hypothetical protein